MREDAKITNDLKAEVDENEASAFDLESLVVGDVKHPDSDSLFIYLCNHISQTTDALRKDIDRQKASTLTIMSFCFLGEVTFVAANYEPLTKSLPALVLVTVAFVLWVVAFGVALIVSKGEGYHIVPGRTEGLSFLPYPDEVKEFERSKAHPFDADTELAKLALMRFDKEKYAVVNDESVVETYNEVIRDRDDLRCFNKNAWLAELGQMLRGQKKHHNSVMVFYKVLRSIFVASIVCVIASMFVLWYVQYASIV